MDVPRLAEAALDLQEVGRLMPNRPACLEGLLAEFRKLRELPRKQELQNQLQGGSGPPGGGRAAPAADAEPNSKRAAGRSR